MYLIRFCRRLVWLQTEILFLTDLFKIQPANTLSPFSVFSSLSSVAKMLKRPRNPWTYMKIPWQPLPQGSSAHDHQSHGAGRENTLTQDHKHRGRGWFPQLPLALRMRHTSMVVTFQSAFPITYNSSSLLRMTKNEKQAFGFHFKAKKSRSQQDPDMVIGFSTERLRFTTLYNTPPSSLLLSVQSVHRPSAFSLEVIALAYRDKSSGNLLTPRSDLRRARLDLHSPNSCKKPLWTGHSISKQNPFLRRLEVGENKI